MRGKSVAATAVRDPSGCVQVESERFTPLAEKSRVFKIPLIRGLASFGAGLATGTRSLMRASEVFGDEGEDAEPSKFESWLIKHFKIDALKLAAGIGVVLGLALAIALFVIAPVALTRWIFSLADISSLGAVGSAVVKELVKGFIKIALLVCYLAVCSANKDLKRVFRYHGAEHKTISCYESGLPLTLENIRASSRIHPRCGTSFIFIVLTVSILFFAVLNSIISVYDNSGILSKSYVEIPIRIFCIPLIAGLSYEVLKFLARHENFFTKALRAPGMSLQYLTTAEPDDGMIECAVTAFETVLAMEADRSIPTTKFSVTAKVSDLRSKLAEMIKGDGAENEIELILMAAAGANNRTALQAIEKLDGGKVRFAEKTAALRASGMPLQYAIGYTNFFGYDILTDKRALIPRFDSEILAEEAVKEIKKRENPSVLELCTGSGAIAIAVSKETGIKVTASDISAEALSLAAENLKKHNANVELIESDLFSAIEGTFDVIIANPPYIASGEIETLDSEVKDYEPIIALDGGADGLSFYRAIEKEYASRLNDGGVLLLEAGFGQAESVKEIFGGEITSAFDYNNPRTERVLSVKKRV